MLTLFGPWISTPLTHKSVPFISDFAKENPIVGSFIVGWLSALQKQHEIVPSSANTSRPLVLDGAECYTFSNLSDVLLMKHWMKHGIVNTSLIPASLKRNFSQLETVSPGVYDFPARYHGRGPGSPTMWRNDIVAALRGADAEGIVWAYSERYDWFGLRNTGKPAVPSEWIAATKAAKAIAAI